MKIVEYYLKHVSSFLQWENIWVISRVEDNSYKIIFFNDIDISDVYMIETSIVIECCDKIQVRKNGIDLHQLNCTNTKQSMRGVNELHQDD